MKKKTISDQVKLHIKQLLIFGAVRKEENKLQANYHAIRSATIRNH